MSPPSTSLPTGLIVHGSLSSILRAGALHRHGQTAMTWPQSVAQVQETPSFGEGERMIRFSWVIAAPSAANTGCVPLLARQEVEVVAGNGTQCTRRAERLACSRRAPCAACWPIGERESRDQS